MKYVKILSERIIRRVMCHVGRFKSVSGKVDAKPSDLPLGRLKVR